MDEKEKEEFWADLGRPEQPEKRVLFSFIVTVENSGVIKTDFLDKNDYVERKATTFEIYQTCKEIVANIESQVMVDRVVEGVVQALKPKDESEEVRDSIRSALSDRGIDTSKA